MNQRQQARRQGRAPGRRGQDHARVREPVGCGPPQRRTDKARGRRERSKQPDRVEPQAERLVVDREVGRECADRGEEGDVGGASADRHGTSRQASTSASRPRRSAAIASAARSSVSSTRSATDA